MDSVLFAALRTFVTLAYFRRMKSATTELDITRQTVMRHLLILSETFGTPLMVLEGHFYILTPVGRTLLPQAERLVEHADALLHGFENTLEVHNGLQQTRITTDKSGDFRSQQHPLWELATDSPSLLFDVYQKWKEADFSSEHPATEDIKPYSILYRKIEHGWFCSHVGNKSAYAKWFGKKWASSAVGSLSTDDPGGADYDRFASKPYDEVLATGSCRLDHHFARLDTQADGTVSYVRYQRLLMPYRLPNQTLVLASVAAITNKINISGIEMPDESLMPDDLLMDGDTL